MHHEPPRPVPWLTKSHVLLWRASILEGEPAVRAWQSWQAAVDMDSVDSESFQMLPLLYLNLKRMGIIHPMMAKLRGIYKHTWFANQVAMRHLFDVLQLLNAAHISVLLLNVLPLILLKYCDSGAFPMRKVDLFIKNEEIDVVDTELQKAGWRLITPLPPRNLRSLFHGITYTHSEGTNLGVNWRPFTIDCSLDMDTQLWKRGSDYSFNGMTTRIPDLNDLLLLICLHGAEAQMCPTPRSLAEAATLIIASESSIDWETIDNRARQIDRQDFFRNFLGHLQRELNVKVPKELIGPSAQHHQDEEGQILPPSIPPPTVYPMPSLLHSLATMWSAYQMLNRIDARKRSSVEFVRFFVSYYQYNWGVRRARMVPLVAVIKLFHRLRRSWSVDGHPQMRRNAIGGIGPTEEVEGDRQWKMGTRHRFKSS